MNTLFTSAFLLWLSLELDCSTLFHSQLKVPLLCFEFFVLGGIPLGMFFGWSGVATMFEVQAQRYPASSLRLFFILKGGSLGV